MLVGVVHQHASPVEAAVILWVALGLPVLRHLAKDSPPVPGLYRIMLGNVEGMEYCTLLYYRKFGAGRGGSLSHIICLCERREDEMKKKRERASVTAQYIDTAIRKRVIT